MNQHEAATADIAGTRQRHGKREARGNRRIHGIAAVGQHVGADLARQCVLRRNHAGIAEGRVSQIRVADDRLALRKRRQGHEQDEDG